MSDLGRRPALPEVQSLHWLDTSALPPGDPEPARLVVVLDVPASPTGTITVAVQAGDGTFTRRLPVQGVVWLAAALAPAGRIDDEAFAELQARFAR